MASTSGAGGIDGDMNFVSIPNVSASAIKTSKKMKVKVNDLEIVLIYHQGQHYAIQAKCPHQGGPLVEGDIEELSKSKCIRCPLHSWKFDLISGECVSPGPNPNKILKIYPLRINNEDVKIGFPKSPPK